MTVANNMTGPRSTKRLFSTFSLVANRLGRVTPDVKTWMERTSLVNYGVYRGIRQFGG